MGAQSNLFDEIAVDLFAGGGGASTGFELATGRVMDIAINHSRDAILMHKTNHPHTEHYQADVFEVDPIMTTRGRPVGFLWASPDCKHFSKAKGAPLVDRKIRGLSWVILRWAMDVRPRVIMAENVEEIQTWGPLIPAYREDGSIKGYIPDPERKGETFRALIGMLTTGVSEDCPALNEACEFLKIPIGGPEAQRLIRGLGYDLEYRELVAADYGAPTIRKRWVMCARCDGQPIIWPEQTHSRTGSGGKKKWRSAAEIIDWSLPMYSIFADKREIKEKYGVNVVRPLADNTLRRCIRGVDKFTIRSGDPFLIECNHVGGGHLFDADGPTGTITQKCTLGACDSVISPVTFSNTNGSVGFPANAPVHTVTSDGKQILSAAQLVSIGQLSGGDRTRSVTAPAPTTVSKAEACLLSSQLIQYHTERTEDARASGLTGPMQTIDSSNRYGMVSATLTEYFGNGVPIDLREPMHTATSHDREALTAAHVVEFKGEDLGQHPARPLRTITQSAGEFAACRAVLAKAEQGRNYGNWPKIRELLNRYCGYEMQDDEIILLLIGGAAYYIHDILLRMLSPRELYNAMGFPPDYIIDRDYEGNEYGKTKQVARCGNAVCPPMAEAMIRANYTAAPVYITTMAQLAEIVSA